MENTNEKIDNTRKETRSKTRLGETLIYHPTNLKNSNLTQPVTPTGTIVNLVPKSMVQIKKEKHILHSLKVKEPKFVPYEPYKAAVNPIIPLERKTRRLPRNNLDINTMVSQMALMRTEVTKEKEPEMKIEVLENKWDIEKREIELEMQKLKEENVQLENQLKFQAQVKIQNKTNK